MKHYSHIKTGATENNCQQSWSQKTNSRVEIKRDAIKVDFYKKSHDSIVEKKMGTKPIKTMPTTKYMYYPYINNLPDK